MKLKLTDICFDFYLIKSLNKSKILDSLKNRDIISIENIEFWNLPAHTHNYILNLLNKNNIVNLKYSEIVKYKFSDLSDIKNEVYLKSQLRYLNIEYSYNYITNIVSILFPVDFDNIGELYGYKKIELIYENDVLIKKIYYPYINRFIFSKKTIIYMDNDVCIHYLIHKNDNNKYIIKKYNRNMLISRENENGDIWKFEYDKFENCVKEIYPDGNFIECEYNESGKLVKELFQENKIYRYEYDEKGNFIKYKIPNGVTVEWVYDNNRNKILTRSIDNKGSINNNIYRNNTVRKSSIIGHKTNYH